MADEVTCVDGVEAKETYEFEIQLFEKYGRCFVKYTYNAPFRPRESQVALYEGQQADPTRHVAWRWADCRTEVAPGDEWDTGRDWGSGYSAALIAQNCDLSTWEYVVRTPVTEDSD